MWQREVWRGEIALESPAGLDTHIESIQEAHIAFKMKTVVPGNIFGIEFLVMGIGRKSRIYSRDQMVQDDSAKEPDLQVCVIVGLATHIAVLGLVLGLAKRNNFINNGLFQKQVLTQGYGIHIVPAENIGPFAHQLVNTGVVVEILLACNFLT